ncbi:proteinral negative regulator of transcription subunit 3 [Sphaceloma murrayae]|uniref:Proteinral negative regulator of transcription subunit 3 n=1 Tax=Sphaceloma murrayae TaxID=2082308 RepID=A0A2K1QT00_9PEZI|nr:proteinral negative regulator of transcription subunit 3 [Sphaceloma murrayae]
MPFEPLAVRRPSAPEKHLDLTAQDAAYRPATVKQKVKQWYGEGGGVVETETPPKEKAWKAPHSPSKSPVWSPAYLDKKELGSNRKEAATLQKEFRNPLLPEGYQAKPIDIIRDTKTGAHALVKTRAPPKATTSSKPGPASWDPQRKVFVRKRESKPQSYGDDEMKLATSPKKRLVSDGHWRKDRSQAKQEDTPQHVPVVEPKPQRIITQKSTPDFRSRPVKSPVTTAFAVRKAPERPTWMPLDPTKNSDVPRMTVPQQSQSRSREREVNTSSVNVERAAPRASKATPTRPRSGVRRTSDRYSFDSDSTERPVDVRRASDRRQHGLNKSNSSPPTSDIDTEDPFSVASPGPDDSISRVGLPRPAVRDQPSPRDEPRKLSKKDRRKTSAPAAQRHHEPAVQAARVTTGLPPVFGNRIEAWLGNQSEDPFWDEQSDFTDDRATSAPSPIPEPLRLRKKEKNGKEDTGRQPLQSSARNRQSSYGQEEYLKPGRLKNSPTNKENRSDYRKASYEVGDEQSFNQRGTSGTQGIGLGINMRREFPTTGKALSTIASEITQGPYQASRPQASVAGDSYAPSSISLTTIGGKSAEPGRKKSTGLKRKLTKHDDLMTVLSMATSAPSLVSANSFRTQKLRMDKQSKEEVLQELAAEESKYQRELQTLVDGVIPVLLSSVLSKSGSRIPSSGLDREGKKQNITQPIVDMGVALERLKAQHKRMPQTNPGALLVWAQTASRIYEDYIRAWRMGFDNVAVNVPKSGVTSMASPATGERVDVSYLLKRPLVRVKSLTKTFRAINYHIPSPDAEAMSERYYTLMVAARKKSNDELARVEDEAASAIDPTRARDPKSLAPLAGVRIDPSRSVRARDYFEMTLKHSTGQQLDCAIEVIIRDNEADPDKGGDVLFCEVSDAGRWLLFPPMIQDMVSTRRGKDSIELITMIRGVGSDGNDWSEILTLHSSTPDAIEEWASMLSEGPVPPSPTETEFTIPPLTTPLTPDADLMPPPLSPTPPSPGGRSEKPSLIFKSRTPSPTEVDVPIGEQARKTSKRWSFGVSMAAELLDQATPRVFKKASGSYPPVSMDNNRSSRSAPNSPARGGRSFDKYAESYGSVTPEERGSSNRRPSLKRSSTVRSRGGTPLRTTTASPRSEYSDSTVRDRSPTRSPQTRRPSFGRSKPSRDSVATSRSSQMEYSVWMPSISSQLSDDDVSSDEEPYSQRPTSRSDSLAPRSPTENKLSRPAMHERTASTPSTDMPTIPRLRPSTTSTSGLARSEESYHLDSRVSSQPQTPRAAVTRSEPSQLSSMVSREAPSSAPGKLQKFVAGFKSEKKAEPKAITQTPTRPKSGIFSAPNFLKNRRPSSPLKREYAPSLDDDMTDSGDDYSDLDTLSTYSSDEEDEHRDQLPPPPTLDPQANAFPKATPPQSLASMSGPSLGPSNSASQGPYRHVPPAPSQSSKTVATIFSWSDRGSWDALHPVEVTIVVSAGLIEAFSTQEAFSVPGRNQSGQDISPSHFGIAPLVALELTPLVPLRRGTALDISVRSPPTANSKIRSSNNVMFRSRSADECERLYGLMNQARINNATYIALQNARPGGEGTWAAAMDARSRGGNGSWFGLGGRRGSTYRSGSVRKRSSAMSESSVGTMNTAFSALRRLSGTWRVKDGNSDSLGSGSRTPERGSVGLGLGMLGAGGDGVLGIKEMKVRLYHREVGNKWRDMGSARLTIMLPDRPESSGSSPVRSGEATPPGPRGENKKRILVKGTTKGETLLDVTLPEGSFERVARTGIAVSVWRDNEGSTDQAGRAVDRGGVAACSQDIFMVQMKSERDAAFTFGLVGKLRY